MALLYNLVKWLHILFAVAALGSNMTYGIWLAMAGRSPAALPFTLRTIRFIDSRVANPSYVMLLLTGTIMLLFPGGYDFGTTWVQVAISLYVLAVLLGIFVYAPVFRRQIALAESPGPGSPEYAAAARRGTLLGIVVTVLVVLIELTMVTKLAFLGPRFAV
jgi:uncharacterized membrane protein